jgi:hypothetical protein
MRWYSYLLLLLLYCCASTEDFAVACLAGENSLDDCKSNCVRFCTGDAGDAIRRVLVLALSTMNLISFFKYNTDIAREDLIL